MSDPAPIHQSITGSNNIFSATGDVYVVHNELSPTDAQTRYNLTLLLTKVHSFWIAGVLDKSLDTVLSLDLGKQLDSTAVDHPWDSVLDLPFADARVLPRGTTITQIFDDTSRALLILGDPGSGKTITLLELARALLSRATDAKDLTLPVPVIFNLATWSHQALLDWMTTELSLRYQIPKKYGRFWLEQSRLLPLLDGLDEVPPGIRGACVDAINRYGVDIGFSGLAVSCRRQEYTALSVRLKLNAAVTLQPLTEHQVDHYLAAAGPSLDSLRSTLRGDAALRSLAQSPLMLNIMSLAYHNLSSDAINDSAMSLEEKRRHLFDAYIDRMLNRRRLDAQPFSRPQTLTRLKWLAIHMLEHQQSIFLIEQLQPSWLSRSTRCSYAIVSRVVNGLLVGFALGVPAGAQTMALGALSGGAAGLGLGIVDALKFRVERDPSEPRLSPSVRLHVSMLQCVPSIALHSIIGGTSCLVFCGSASLLLLGPLYGIVVGLIGGILVGPVFGLIFGVRALQRNLQRDIVTVESFRWSWRRCLFGGVAGLFVGSVIGTIVAIATTTTGRSLGPTLFGPVQSLITGYVFGPIVGLMTGLLAGLSGTRIDEKAGPNEGVHRSSRNAVLTGLAGGTAGAIALAPLGGSMLALCGGMLTALWYGGMDVIQHYILRVMLTLTGSTPWRLARFLDYAVDHVLLRRVGGGYIFIHRLLLEHIAAIRDFSERSER